MCRNFIFRTSNILEEIKIDWPNGKFRKEAFVVAIDCDLTYYVQIKILYNKDKIILME